RTASEELPESLGLLRRGANPAFDLRSLERGCRAARRLGEQLGAPDPVPIVSMPHHANHAWFSYCASPFARQDGAAIVAVLDGTGDDGAISLYVAEAGALRRVHSNNSLIDSLGVFYSVISSTQGGWTWLSSEGRYMGAAAYGNMDRLTNPFYAPLREVLSLTPDGEMQLNRSLANWHRDLYRRPYSRALVRILGEPIATKDSWNPDAVLRVEDISHKENTRERLDKAAATQLVFQDPLFHII